MCSPWLEGYQTVDGRQVKLPIGEIICYLHAVSRAAALAVTAFPAIAGARAFGGEGAFLVSTKLFRTAGDGRIPTGVAA